MRRRLGLVALATLAAIPLPAGARATATLESGRLFFFADTLGIVARDGASLVLPDGTRARGDAAYVDLRDDRAILAGDARIEHRDATLHADAIAVDLDDDRVDLLDAASGATTTTRGLATPSATEIDASRFAFPDLDDAHAYIRSRRATITAHASARFSPAAFPTSVGALPVPSYLYTYATAAGFGATSLPGAAFDQPYGLFGTPSSLTALHARWIDGSGPSLGLQEQLVSGDTAYLAASIDAPLHGIGVRGLNAYRRLDDRSTFTLAGTSTIYGWSTNAALTRTFGRAIGRLTYGLASGGFSTADLSLRSPDRPLFAGATWSVLADLGFDAQRGGLLTALPDAPNWPTVWRHGIDASVATPVVRGPFQTRVAATFDAKRTWYAFPHYRDDLAMNATVSRTLSRTISLFAGYAADWSNDVYPTAQALFYPPTLLPAIAPDGTPWPDRAAFTGAGMLRGESLTAQLTPNPNTTLRVSIAHNADFPQFHGYGLPAWAMSADARFRPFPNIGLDVGRSYEFDWGGTRWLPRWNFAVTP
jgi:hypothetical protein